MIEWAFGEYFKTGTYPPKPADITKLIRQKREAMMADTHTATSEEEWQRIQADRANYFASNEYKTFLKRIQEKFDKGFGNAEPKRVKPAKVSSTQVEQREEPSDSQHAAGARSHVVDSGASEPL